MRDLNEGMPILQHFCLEHRHLNEVVCATGQLLTEVAEERAGALAREKVFQALEELRHLLGLHFQEEEEDGYMEEALVRLPRLTEQVAALHQQHAGLLAEIDSLLACLNKQTLEDVRLPFAEFAKRLHAHETGENRVMAEAFGTDFADVADSC